MKIIRLGIAFTVMSVTFAAAPISADAQLMGREHPESSRPGPRGIALHPLAIRNGPGKSHVKLGEFPKGASLVFLSPPGCMSGYCFVQGPGGVRGWILTSAVERTSGGANARSDVVGYGISRNDLNLRSAPSQSASKIRVIPKGETLHMLKSPLCRSGYCYVETPRSERGWVLRSAISIHGF